MLIEILKLELVILVKVVLYLQMDIYKLKQKKKTGIYILNSTQSSSGTPNSYKMGVYAQVYLSTQVQMTTWRLV